MSSFHLLINNAPTYPTAVGGKTKALQQRAKPINNKNILPFVGVP
jgi:hypothetical protein